MDAPSAMELHNVIRAQQGLAPLQWSEQLEANSQVILRALASRAVLGLHGGGQVRPAIPGRHESCREDGSICCAVPPINPHSPRYAGLG